MDVHGRKEHVLQSLGLEVSTCAFLGAKGFRAEGLKSAGFRLVGFKLVVPGVSEVIIRFQNRKHFASSIAVASN